MITFNEKMWLYSRGGRTEADVCEDEFGKYVYMSSGVKDEQVKVYIPTDFEFTVHNVHSKKELMKMLKE